MLIYYYAFFALMVAPLLGALLAVLLPPRMARHAGRIATGVCSLAVAFLWFAPPVQSGNALVLVYPGTQAPCLSLDAFAWIPVAMACWTCFAAMLWGRKEAPGPDVSPPVDAWLMVALFFAIVAPCLLTVTEAIAAVGAIGLLPALYALLGLNEGGRKRVWLWPLVAAALACGFLYVASATSQPRNAAVDALEYIPQAAPQPKLSLLALGLAAYIGTGLFPFVWHRRFALVAGLRAAAFLEGSAVLLPGLLIVGRVTVLSHGRVHALQHMHGTADALVWLAGVTAAWHLASLVFERDIARGIGLLAGLHATYLFLALLLFGLTRQSGYEALCFLLIARAVTFPLLYLSLDWLRPELGDLPFLGRLHRAAARAPWATAALVLGLASAVGVPPLPGFLGKWALYRAAVEVNAEWARLVLVIVGIEGALVIRWVVRAWRTPSEAVVGARDVPLAKRLVLTGLVVAGVGALVGPTLVGWVAHALH